MKVSSTLALDRGSKQIGLAYQHQGSTVVMPLGTLLNDGMLYFSLGDIFARYRVNTLVIGWPTKQEDIQQHINDFLKKIEYLFDAQEVQVVKVDEDYTSVEAGEIVSLIEKDRRQAKRSGAEDTVSAMNILERWNTENKA